MLHMLVVSQSTCDYSSGSDFPNDQLGICSAVKADLSTAAVLYPAVCTTRTSLFNFSKATQNMRTSRLSEVQHKSPLPGYALWMPTKSLMPRLFSTTLTFQSVAAERSTWSEIEVTSAAYPWGQSSSRSPKLSQAAAN